MKTRVPFYIALFVVLVTSLACGTSQKAQPPAATPTPIPGFSEIKAENISLWLPDSFEGGDLKNDLDVVVSNLRSFGSEYDNIASMIESNPDVFLVWAYDSNIGPSGNLTNVNITHEQVVSAVTLEMYADAVKQQLPSSFTITDQKIVKLGDNDALRLEIELSESGMNAKELMYAVKVDNTVYCITYSTGADEFDTRLPTFEQSASTFKVQE